MHFSEEEMAGRLARVRARMAESGLDGLVLTDAANMTYLTGMPAAGSSYVPQAVIVAAGRAEPYIVCRAQDRYGAVLTTRLSPDSLIGYGEELIGRHARTGHDYLFEFARDAVPAGAIGVELGQLSANAERKARAIIGEGRIRDCTGLVNDVRLIKSEAEIEIIRQASAVSANALWVATREIRAGRPEYEAAGEILKALVVGAPGIPGDWARYMEMTTGKRLGAPHLAWSEEPFALDAQVNIEMNGRRHRYGGGLTRSIQIGEPADRLKRVHDVTLEGFHAALGAIRPGVPCEDVWRAFNASIGRHGFHKASRCGYSIGVEWDDGTASLGPGDRTIIAPNMVFHVMLGMWIGDDWGYGFSEVVAVTESGARSLADMPREILRAVG